MEYEKKYKELVGKIEKAYLYAQTDSTKAVLEEIRPELRESEDERIRNVIRGWIYTRPASFFDNGISKEEMLAWLEKQGSVSKLNDEEQNKFAKGVLTSCALSFINYLDAHKYDGKMCVSNGECEDIENAFHNAMWDRLHRYYCKYIEKQDEQKEYTFKSLPRLLEMVEPTERAKAYCQKLIDTLVKEGYSTDAKIVGECLKQMNGEKVALATMDEKQGKPKWSEEDEQYLLVCKNALKKYDITDKWDSTIIIRWLENKIKQRMEE